MYYKIHITNPIVLNGEILKAKPLKTGSIEGFQLSYLQYKIYESIKVSYTFLKNTGQCN